MPHRRSVPRSTLPERCSLRPVYCSTSCRWLSDSSSFLTSIRHSAVLSFPMNCQPCDKQHDSDSDRRRAGVRIAGPLGVGAVLSLISPVFLSLPEFLLAQKVSGCWNLLLLITYTWDFIARIRVASWRHHTHLLVLLSLCYLEPVI